MMDLHCASGQTSSSRLLRQAPHRDDGPTFRSVAPRRAQGPALQPSKRSPNHAAFVSATRSRHLCCASSTGGGAAASPGDAGEALQQRQDAAIQSDQGGQAATPEERTQQALRLAQEALVEAQHLSEHVDQLPSARERWQGPRRLLLAAKPLLSAALCAGVWVSHAAGLAWQAPVALLTGVVIGLQGMRRGSLNTSGAVAAVLVGGATLGSSLRCGATLLAFFFASSKLTRYAEDRKNFDDDFKPGGQRDWKQVVCNALVPAGVALALVRYTGGADVLLGPAAGRAATHCLGAFLGYCAACCGDTWSSEVGQLSTAEPRLITTLRPVRPGTNGGVTPLGLGAGVAGGAFVGLVFFLAGIVSPSQLLADGGWRAALAQWPLIPLGLVAGLVGSVIDSVLGATIQFTGFNRKTGKLTSKYSSDIVPISGIPLLSNNEVNLVSASLCALLTSRAALLVFA